MFESFRHLRRTAEHPGRIVISNEGAQLDLISLDEQVRALMRILPSSTGRTMVLLALRGGPHFTAMLLAALGSNSVIAPVPSRPKEREARAYLDLVRPDLVVVESLETTASLVRDLECGVRILSFQDPSGEHRGNEVLGWREVMEGRHGPVKGARCGLPPEIAMIQFTSGSTSQPKGILVSHGNLRANLETNRDYLQGFRECDVYCPIPQFHAMGGAVMLEHLLSGCAVHVSNRFFLGEELERMRRFRCRALLTSPNHVKLLLRFGVLTPEQLPDLDTVIMGTALVESALIDEIRAAMPHLEIHVRYGLSESVGTAARAVLRAGESLDHWGMVGAPVECLELGSGVPRLGDGEPAEIRVRGSTVAVGELCCSEGSKPLVDDRGFLCTGDLGYEDSRGRLHLRGRKSTFLKSNGYRISPFELESVLRSHPAVQEAAVIGIPDPLTGQRIVACLESAPGLQDPTPQEMIDYCEERLSSYKIPKVFRWHSPLPRTSAGKPDRQKLESLAAC